MSKRESTGSPDSRTCLAGRLKLKDDLHRAIREAFLAAIWGSDAEAQEAIEPCEKYDAEPHPHRPGPGRRLQATHRGGTRLARLQTSLGLRPVYHHREDRIRAHLCWLALLLIRVAETRAGDTWRNLRHELDRMHLVTFATADGRVAQRSAPTGDQKTILAALDLPETPQIPSHPAPAPPPTDEPARITGPNRLIPRLRWSTQKFGDPCAHYLRSQVRGRHLTDGRRVARGRPLRGGPRSDACLRPLRWVSIEFGTDGLHVCVVSSRSLR
jgi:hypothetical protein